jgi:hypothetical protein
MRANPQRGLLLLEIVMIERLLVPIRVRLLETQSTSLTLLGMG